MYMISRAPNFVDFRGRIYRTDYLNFHERDLARSLLLFSTNDIGHAQNMEWENLSNSIVQWVSEKERFYAKY
jgi:DNA-directed RNA polymerase